MKSLLAIANAAAGSSDDEATAAAVETLQAAYDVALVATSSPSDLETALKEHPDLHAIAVLGGDGSLHAVVAALRAADRLDSVTVGLVPLGTGNDFASTLDLPDDPVLAAGVIVAGKTQELDLIVDGSDRVVVNVAHIGIGAEAAMAAAPLKKVLGPMGYVAGALVASFKGLATPGAKLAITVDGTRTASRRSVIQLAVGNGRFVGGGAPLLPEADPADGKLDLMITYAGPRHRRVAYAWKIKKGLHHRHADVVYRQGTNVSVLGDRLPCTSDGELTDPAPGHSWRVEPGALTMFVS